MTSADFLTALYGSMSPESRLLIWTLPGKRSDWSKSPAAAAEKVNDLKAEHDVYFGLGLRAPGFGVSRRGDSADVLALPGLWGDFDLAHSVHSKSSLPVHPEQVTDLLRISGVPDPTITVHSGHGLQLHWLFPDLWCFADDAERDDAAHLSILWNASLRLVMRSRGWSMDSTYDLARVLRVPGTYNRKQKDDLKLVSVLDCDLTRRFTPDDLRGFLPTGIEEYAQQTQTSLAKQKGEGAAVQAQTLDGLVFDPEAQYDVDKFHFLCELEPKFLNSFNRKRKDFKSGDESASEYDMSLATYAHQAGWSDQEIVNLIICHRRKHGSELKFRSRQSYYLTTLIQAKHGSEKIASALELGAWNAERSQTPDLAEGPQETADEALDEPGAVSAELFRDVPPVVVDAATVKTASRRITVLDARGELMREKDLRHLSACLDIAVLDVIRYVGGEQASFALDVGQGRISVPNVDSILSQIRLRNLIAGACLHVIPKYKGSMWDQISQTLLNACRDEVLGDGSAPMGQMREYLNVYLDMNPPSRELTEDVIAAQGAWVDADGTVCIFGAGFSEWLSICKNTLYTPPIFGRLLRQMGATPFQQKVVVGRRKSSRSAWALPLSGKDF